MAHVYIKLEQYHYAIKYASQALEKDPENTKALFRKGIAYTKVGELQRARECLDDVARIDPKMVIRRLLDSAKMFEPEPHTATWSI